MDAGFLGSIVTVLFFLIFIGIVWWVYHKENKHKHEEAANLPFEEGDEPSSSRRA
jgi:cytochrome c oxidase cbb3-type subunit 4